MMFAAETAPDMGTYHNGSTKTGGHRTKAPDIIDRKVIAWDMEGISLSGMGRPQHAVLFGNSAEVTAPITGEKLSTSQMLDSIISTGRKYPHALHVGYGFKYDANMIIAGLPERVITRLWTHGSARYDFGDLYTWTIGWIPGKKFTVTRRRKGIRRDAKANGSSKVTVTIYDFLSFFGTKFLDTCERILGSELSNEDREVIEHGKAARGSHSDMAALPEIRHYWEREIMLMRRVFEKFREVMYRAGFALREWYGPGALANYINATRNIRPKLVGVQTTSGLMPSEVHVASKVAFSGGRFELFKAGRTAGPIHAVDINSAYPYALTKLPSFAGGTWRHVERPTSIELFGIYRIKWRSPNPSPFQVRPQPLFWRDHRGMISYPDKAHGWYYSPEAAAVLDMDGIEVIEGWEWQPSSDERPWEFLMEMYATRMRLGKDNLMSMPFKLGPNSLYGKYAQTVGWDQKRVLPPKSHALPVAGWVTSYCRAMLWQVIRQDPSSVIAVETDSVFTTRNPSSLSISLGDALGQWSVTTYDDIIYMQNGMYHTRQGEEWNGVKSRGMSATEFPIEKMLSYMDTLTCTEAWPAIRLETSPRFIGAGAAIASNAPLKAIHTSWRSQTKEMRLGDTGKRVHNHKTCVACAQDIRPSVSAHRLIVHSLSDGECLSFPRRLPWEQQQTAEVEAIRSGIEVEADLLEAK